jgi:transcriptional regulator with XRE-family HTH domain
VLANAKRILGDNIRIRRDLLNLTQSELAERADISFRMVQKMEYGQTWAAANTLEKVARALNCELWELMVDLHSGANPKEIASSYYDTIQAQAQALDRIIREKRDLMGELERLQAQLGIKRSDPPLGRRSDVLEKAKRLSAESHAKLERSARAKRTK